METHERRLVLEQLTSSEAQLLKLVDGLTPKQWSFQETPERWSIAGNIEHLILFEDFITGVIAKTIEESPEPDKKTLASPKEPLVLGLANSRSTRFTAREVVRPSGKWPDTAEMVAELQKSRARSIAFASQTQADLRSHFFPHISFGDLDCYQWLMVLGRHSARHALQIEQIKADPSYPAA